MQTPKIIAFANQKGGSGKSTSAAHAAFWLAQKGLSVMLVDADGQQSSSAWLNELGLDYKVLIDPEQLFESLPAFSDDYDVVVVDGPGSLSEVTKAILTRCDLVLVPVVSQKMLPVTKLLRFLSETMQLIRRFD
ncbi:ParA family protein [Acaryochloris marina]|uniref:ParA family protein n=1 Tax=Acaryochloris marina TaxID=155978 RepID=UPI002018385D|nr:ParA family protein [Acaryochloris marina]